jgi:DNA-binding NtrC family response regulator
MAIVKGHEGWVDVVSEPSRGTTFRVYLPAAASSLKKRKSQLIQIGMPRGKNETILVVDDETSILTITGQTLEAFGYQVLTAGNGAEAIAAYVEHMDKIAAVLTDMMMPVMDGASTIQSLIRINPQVKIIATSGLKTTSGVVQLANEGIKHFLKKPYTASTLLTTVRTVLDEVQPNG